MSWNYRIIATPDSYALHEVYYDENGQIDGWTQEPTSFSAFPEEGPEGIVASLTMALADAQKHPVLVLSLVNGEHKLLEKVTPGTTGREEVPLEQRFQAK